MSTEQLRKELIDYVNAANTSEERNRRKFEVHGYMYSAGPQKLMTFYLLKEERLWSGG